MEKDFVISGVPLEKALQSLEDGLKDPQLEQNILLRDGVIQRFEYSFELAWKILQRVLEQQGYMDEDKILSKKDIFRIAFQKHLIQEAEIWFEFLEARNESAHLYNPATADKVFAIAKKFPAELKKLISLLKKHGFIA
jgi:nucleotidyltransferase substrate binding protein (TIGR01987 family)